MEGMKVFGVMGGEGVAEHSLSPRIWNAVFRKRKINAVYGAFEVREKELARAVEGIRTLGISGVNITTPHKIKAVKFIDEISPEVGRIGAVNTISNKNGILRGFNTDASALKRLLRNEKKGKVVILGAGGAARAAAFAAATAGEIIMANHTPSNAIEIIRKMGLSMNARAHVLNGLEAGITDTDIVINCTPIGMYASGTPLEARL
ncbi:MAG: shikimate dehydrogenase, partial [Candidatus Micrarchaeota archaeon]